MRTVLKVGFVAFIVGTTYAHADSSSNFSQAAGDSAEATARIVASGGQVAIGAIALPIMLAGETAQAAGEGSSELGEELWDAANAPLTVDDDVVVAQAPPSLDRLKTGDE